MFNRKRKDEDDDNGNESEDNGTQKKPRVIWSIELHRKFVSAVNQLGIEKAVPKRILDLMNVNGITRENVASHLQITSKCLSQILQLQHIEDLILEGCYGIDDDGLATIKVGCKSLQKLDVSSSQNVSHVGLSSLTNVAGFLQQLNLSYGSRVDLDLANSLGKLSMLQSIKLDGCQVTCSGLKAIANGCVSLQELNLSKCMGVTDEGLSSVVTKHKDMKKLDITCCRKITKMSLANEMYCVRFVPYEDGDLGKGKKEAYCVVAIESIGRQLPIAYLERVKDDFSKKYGGGKAATAVANSLNKEFGPKLKEQMQYCVDHPEEISKLSKVKAQVSEVKGVLDRGEKIELLVDKTENLHSQHKTLGHKEPRLGERCGCRI
ncbi:hypothetical protein CASFOL_040466 [Castilleja foliolosa]|uniref:Longin domain-containing protein n=1 Tax=Castilleja foliolosa TaxID=1961234 RepID=A0ABD3BBQ9_9LAMI